MKTQAFTTASIPSESSVNSYSGAELGSANFLKMPELTQDLELKEGETIIIPIRDIQMSDLFELTNRELFINSVKYVTVIPSDGRGVKEELNIEAYLVFSKDYTSNKIRDWLAYYSADTSGLVALSPDAPYALSMFTIVRITE